MSESEIMPAVETDRLATFRSALESWRLLSPDEQFARIGAAAPDRPPLPPGGRVRVGIWCPCLLRGGAETWQLSLARAVDADRIAWQGCCAVGGSGHAYADLMDAMARTMPVSAGIEEASRIAARCEVLVTWAGLDPAPLLADLPRKPVVVCVVHNPGVAYGGNGPIPPDSVDRYVGVSGLVLDAIPQDRRDDTRIIANAVDPEHLTVRRDRATMRALWGVPEGVKVAGYLGRLSAEKDPGAMARLAADLPESWHVVIVGEGPEMAGLPGVDRLHPVGADPAAGDVLNAFDVLAVPSRYESFGLTIAEGLWMGVPVVSTAVGIAQEPGLTYQIPFEADGATIGSAVREAHSIGPKPCSREIARERWGLDRFAREWSDYLCEVGREARLARVNACPERGSVLPISLQDDCGCKGKELTECRARKGCISGRVTLHDCLACVAI